MTLKFLLSLAMGRPLLKTAADIKRAKCIPDFMHVVRWLDDGQDDGKIQRTINVEREYCFPSSLNNDFVGKRHKWLF